jgi:hypothetical protein
MSETEQADFKAAAGRLLEQLRTGVDRDVLTMLGHGLQMAAGSPMSGLGAAILYELDGPGGTLAWIKMRCAVKDIAYSDDAWLIERLEEAGEPPWTWVCEALRAVPPLEKVALSSPTIP